MTSVLRPQRSEVPQQPPTQKPPQPGGSSRLLDWLLFGLTALAVFLVYRQTAAPSVAAIFDDGPEFLVATQRLAILHPTGYPLFSILLKLFSFLPFGELAFRLNLLSAVSGAAAIGAICGLALEVIAAGGQRVFSDRLAAILAALVLAFSPVFWSQAVAVEVYALGALLSVLATWAVLRAVRLHGRGALAAALLIGLGLTHHRTFVLVFPALAAFLLASRPNPRSVPARHEITGWARALWPALIPLLLYLYIPLRGGVGSVDGTYRNTISGFFSWIFASSYLTFFGENALAKSGDPLSAYLSFLIAQAGVLGTGLAVLGIVWLVRRSWRMALLLVMWFAVTAAFAVLYRVPDPEVFALPSLLPLTVAMAGGIAAIGRALPALARGRGGLLRFLAASTTMAVLLALFLFPLRQFSANYEESDLSAETTVRAYGLDVLSQPIRASGGIVALLGEASILHYLQADAQLRPDISVQAVDSEDGRRAAVDRMIAEGREVYLTRPLPGLAQHYPLTSVGPLIAVVPEPETAPPAGMREVERTFGDIDLLGYTTETINGYGLGSGGPSDLKPVARSIRVTLYWRAASPQTEDLRTFIHLSDALGERWTQADGTPVHGAYPTTEWRPGQIVADTLDLPIPLGLAPGDYTLFAGLTKANGEVYLTTEQTREVRLGPAFLNSRTGGYTLRRMDLTPAFARFNGITLVGQRIGPSPLQPGAMLTIETLWRSDYELNQSLNLVTELIRDGESTPLGSGNLGGRYTTVRWQVGEFVRDRQTFRLPTSLQNGKYQVRLSVGDGQYQIIGTIEVQGRERVFTLTTPPPNQSNARLGSQVELIGWGAHSARIDTADDAVEITLYWRALSPLDTDYTVFTHLIGPNNQLVAQHDGPPADGVAPTAGWLPNEIITDKHIIRLPPGVQPSNLRLVVGMYESQSGRRLGFGRNDAISLGPLRLSS